VRAHAEERGNSVNDIPFLMEIERRAV